MIHLVMLTYAVIIGFDSVLDITTSLLVETRILHISVSSSNSDTAHIPILSSMPEEHIAAFLG